MDTKNGNELKEELNLSFSLLLQLEKLSNVSCIEKGGKIIFENYIS